jgi:ribonuclease T1
LAGAAAIAVLLLTLLACSATGNAAVNSQPAAGAPESGAGADSAAAHEPGANASGVSGSAPERQRTPTPTRRPRITATPTRGSSQTIDGMAVIHLDELPREALDTLRLIDRGGPFPYSKDGATFQNREGLLPRKPSGYYAEYTVITPGENDRGARRIIAGDGDEFYYTGDHYDSFKRIVR